MRRLVFVVVVISAVFAEEEKVFKVSGLDSYLEAYRVTHGDSANDLLDKAVQKIDREFVEQGGGYPYPNPQPQYGPPSGPAGYNYGPPTPQYGPLNSGPAYGPPNPPPPAYGPPNPPPPAYGPPNPPPPAYGPPNPPPPPAYGPPNPLPPVYGPPNPPPVYGPPAPPPVYGPPPAVQVFYGMPHAMLSIWDKLKFKLDLFTIGKILLKLVIFKKIVSLIAILCLLLFIPSLKHKVGSSNSDDDDMMRNLNQDAITSGDESLNNVSAFVLDAIETFSNKKQGNKTTECDTILCKTQNIIRKMDKKLTYKKLAKLYSKELKT